MASRKAAKKNEDLAIVTTAPLPGNILDFTIADEVLREFFHARRIDHGHSALLLGSGLCAI